MYPITLLELAAASLCWEDLPDSISYQLYERAKTRHINRYSGCLRELYSPKTYVERHIPKRYIPLTESGARRFWEDLQRRLSTYQ